MAHLSLTQAREKLETADAVSVPLFGHGTLEIAFFRPDKVDGQTPHDRDEIYMIASGRGAFINGSVRSAVAPGDVLFIPAGREHRFVDFSEDLAAWVFFYGPKGGEAEQPKTLTADEQMAQFEDALKEEDWGHQPC